ncbi:hypothetical protein, partial [Streptomyces sp. ISL-100]|uniref:hypothetical protein n=1 Tax=Streptomyces sp. ISL-100 TaxID=2819173 RepID=UPI001BEAADDD
MSVGPRPGGRHPNYAGTPGQLVQQSVLRHQLVQGADQFLDVCFEPGVLFGVRGPQFPEAPDLPTQPPFAVRLLPAGADLRLKCSPG